MNYMKWFLREAFKPNGTCFIFFFTFNSFHENKMNKNVNLNILMYKDF